MNDPGLVRLAGSLLDRNRHVCGFFHGNPEEYRVLLPRTRGRFDERDRARQIIHPRNREDRVRRLEQAGIAVAEAERTDQFEIPPRDDAPPRTGARDLSR